MLVVADEQTRRLRMKELEQIKNAEEKKAEEEKKNDPDFTQTTKMGWKRLREMSKKNPGAVGLYSLLAENIGFNVGAVIADQAFLAQQLEVTPRTIYNWTKFLEKEKALVKIPVSGRVYAYALNPTEVWKGYKNSKPYAVFNTKTLLNKDGLIQKKLMSMFKPENEDLEVDEK